VRPCPSPSPAAASDSPDAKGSALTPSCLSRVQTMAYLGDWTAVVDRSKVEKGPQGELTGRAACA